MRVITESSSQALFSGPMSPLFKAGQRREQLREAFADGSVDTNTVGVIFEGKIDQLNKSV